MTKTRDESMPAPLIGLTHEELVAAVARSLG